MLVAGEQGLDVVLWGATGHAKVLAECLAYRGHNVVALFDNDASLTPPLPNTPLYIGVQGFTAWKEKRSSGDLYFLVAVGGDRGQDRTSLHELLQAHGLKPLSVVHPTAFVAASAQVGAGCQILARAAVCVDVQLGIQTIINTAASVDHETVLGMGVHVAPGATLAGCVHVADYATIGTGAVVLPRIRVGSNSLVGAGSVVTRDVPDNTVVWGNPARVMRVREEEICRSMPTT